MWKVLREGLEEFGRDALRETGIAVTKNDTGPEDLSRNKGRDSSDDDDSRATEVKRGERRASASSGRGGTRKPLRTPLVQSHPQKQEKETRVSETMHAPFRAAGEILCRVKASPYLTKCAILSLPFFPSSSHLSFLNYPLAHHPSRCN